MSNDEREVRRDSITGSFVVRDRRAETAIREKERRDKVREVSDRVRAENREILNRLATK